jgi:hypothetical protein
LLHWLLLLPWESLPLPCGRLLPLRRLLPLLLLLLLWLLDKCRVQDWAAGKSAAKAGRCCGC